LLNLLFASPSCHHASVAGFRHATQEGFGGRLGSSTSSSTIVTRSLPLLLFLLTAREVGLCADRNRGQ
jgi:hypothetical protein